MALAEEHKYAPTFNGPEGQEDMPWLLTMGPVTTSRDVKLAMLADWGMRDTEFVSLALGVTEQLLELVDGTSEYDCIPLHLSGDAMLESVLGALAPTGRKRKTLIAAHGPHAEQAASILTHIKRPVENIAGSALKPVTTNRLAKLLEADPDIHTVYLAEVDVFTGLANPVAKLAAVAHEAGRKVVLDARASIGAMPLNLADGTVDAAVGVPWACIESVPGFSFVMVRRSLLADSLFQSPSSSLDLVELWKGIHRTGWFPGTPPAHSIVACGVALRRLYLEGGPEMRRKRYQEQHLKLLSGMAQLGFTPALADGTATCGYLTLFRAPADRRYSPAIFIQRLRQMGFVIMDGNGCPGAEGGFRVATVGAIDETVTDQFVRAVEKIMRDLGMRSGVPAR
ncbi:aminotransferase class V-fold PLP-dependent enzyme [Anderseniella sp. Alg231-50]|uniref:aminotransferase class V-fold PLP-dependent enzyme n=1 Tax=Anderseniella sp. Alg231-50 TaxID=1922226 RepID=UPI000D54FB63